MTDPDLDAIEQRAKAATPGPWAVWHDLDRQGFKTVGDAHSYQEILDSGETEECNPTAHVYTDEDAEFIAHARTDVPALLARGRELEAGVRSARAEALREAAFSGLFGTNAQETLLVLADRIVKGEPA